MSNENVTNALASMLSQYENNNKPKFVKSEAKTTFSLKNYFHTALPDGIASGTKTIRILPMADGSTPFVELHTHKATIDGQTKQIPCLKKEKGIDCPFCEAREALLATGKEADKELAKKYNARMMYVVKVIDRDAEEDGIKFWRFAHDYRKEGVYDKIIGILNAIKKDITSPETGRDLLITINRNQNKVPIVSAIAALDPSQLSTDVEQSKAWLSDTRTWESVYGFKTYDFMEILVKGGTPVWSKEEGKIVDKASINYTPDNNSAELELSLGTSNVKPNIKTASAVATSITTADDIDDDLPF